jgi:hypothetical protein
MKAIARRLCRLEERFGPAVESQFTRELRERIEAGRRRVAEWRKRDGLAPLTELTQHVAQNGYQSLAERITAARYLKVNAV